METIYTKFTDYRRPRFRLMTSIHEDPAGTKTVTKKNAPGGHADEHMQQIVRNRSVLEDLYGGMPAVCPCRPVPGGLEFPFIEGTSWLDLLREAAADGGLEAFIEGLESYIRILEGPEVNQIPFSYTEAFGHVFGYAAGLDGVPALAVANLDASPGNLIRGEDGTTTLIDYEWVFEFPVPRDFILYRHLRFLLAEQGFPCFDQLTLGKLLHECGVRLSIGTLNAMYDGFQRYVCVEPGSALSCAEVMERHRKPVFTGAPGAFRRPPHFVFLDRGSGFNEQDKLILPGEDGEMTVSLDVEGVRSIRFDPFEGQRTLAEHLRFVTDSGQELPYEAASSAPAGLYTLLNVPANITVMIPPGTAALTVSGFVRQADEQADFWLGQVLAAEGRAGQTAQVLEAERLERTAAEAAGAAEEQRLAAALAASEQARAQAAAAADELRATIQSMQSSKSWRATAWLRRLRARLRRQ